MTEIHKTAPPALSALPRYEELPIDDAGFRSGWHQFGATDSIGLLNLQTPETVLTAAKVIRRGALFALSAPTTEMDPPISLNRTPPRHRVFVNPASGGMDDVIDNYFPQASSQWDSLAHVPADGIGERYYNGATRDEVLRGERNTIDYWARRGIAGRGVLVDIARARAARGQPFDPGAPETIESAEIAGILAETGTSLRPGDLLFVRTGFLSWLRGLGRAEREAVRRDLSSPGLAPTEETAAFLWDAHVSAIVSDNFAVEVWPRRSARTAGELLPSLHRTLIGQFGMALGELWWLDDLAADCAADGTSEFFVVSAPIHQPGGIGSPANAVAIK